jgi:cyclopropane-fatty-acyl-phospholipid synthase
MTMMATRSTTAPQSPAPLRRRAGLHGTIARRVLESMARRVPVDIVLPDGSLLGGPSGRPAGHGFRSGPNRPVLEVRDPDALFERVGRDPKIGIGEAYMAGEWSAAPGSDLADLLTPFAERMTELVPPALTRLRRLVDRRIPDVQRNTSSGSRRNIEAHYDLSNDLFAAFLDDTMTYSSALFDQTRPWSGQSLEEAQLRKVRAVLDQAGVRAGSRVLEIGTGWGTLAIEAARRGALVTTLTLSAEQATLARDRVDRAGLADRVEVRLQDYREVSGTFDAIVSVEMIEAVGEEFWPAYFTMLRERLAPGGAVAIQAILMSHDRYLATRHSYGWIQKHIFPGGLIPSLEQIERTARRAGLQVTEVRPFGRHYAETLRRWRARFLAAWPQIADSGFDETFRRKWEFYLAYSEAGFASGYLDVAVLGLEATPEGVRRG